MQKSKHVSMANRWIKHLLCAVLVLCLCCVTACQRSPSTQDPIPDREYDEAQVLSAAREMLPKTAVINDIFYGYGIPWSQDTDAYTNGVYTEADGAFLAEFGIESLDDLRERAREVYSLSHCNSMFQITLESLYDGETFVGAKRYFEEAATEEHPYRMMVNRSAMVLLPDRVEYHMDTLTVTGSRGEKVYVTVDVTVTAADDESKTQTRTLSFALIEESVGWRFDELTGTKYFTFD